jgi:septum formation protein
LLRAGFTFETYPPKIDEELLKNDLLKLGRRPVEIAEELSVQKGLNILSQFSNTPEVLVISGDQLVELQGRVLGKPGNFENAFKQLLEMQNKNHQLITSITLSSSKEIVRYNSITQLRMRRLNEKEIKNYLLRDQPYDCAGSYKIEQNGIVLFESIISDDFTAIQGIPMIWLCNKLKEYNYELFRP